MYKFHIPYRAKNEVKYTSQVLESGKTAYGGSFSTHVESEISKRIGVKSFFTASCTKALEYTSLLVGIQPGDEVILPTYTFPSTANAFALRGAKLIFVDSSLEHPNMDLKELESKINHKTKVILPMYYGGVALDWKVLKSFQDQYGVVIIEEAAHAFGAFFKDKNQYLPLGGIGDLSVFSFHETKNISCGEGGAVGIKDIRKWKELEAIFNDGTDKLAFERGEVAFYQWCSMGSSFGGSEINAAILQSQLEEFEVHNGLRKDRWNSLWTFLRQSDLKDIELPVIPSFAQHNAHVFYLTFPDLELRLKFEKHMEKAAIPVYPHYRCLHKSKFGLQYENQGEFSNANKFENGLVRLPLNDQIPVDLLLDSIQRFIKLV